MFKNKWRKTAHRASRALELQAREQQQPPPAPKRVYLDDACHRTYSCVYCRAHLANHDELISKLFQGNHGRAYLFNKVVNIGCKSAVQRELLTGPHAVADIYCDSCETTLGWKYEQAFVPSQKYKEGKYIIELAHMLKENNWDLGSHNAREFMDYYDKNDDDDDEHKLVSFCDQNERKWLDESRTASMANNGHNLNNGITIGAQTIGLETDGSNYEAAEAQETVTNNDNRIVPIVALNNHSNASTTTTTDSALPSSASSSNVVSDSNDSEGGLAISHQPNNNNNNNYTNNNRDTH